MKLFLKIVAWLIWLFVMYESSQLVLWLMNQASDFAMIGGLIVVAAMIAVIAKTVSYLTKEKK